MSDEIESSNDAPERAFRAQHEFLGNKLEPFSHLRRTAAENLGLQLFKMSPDSVYETLGPDGEPVQMYTGVIRDVGIVLWVCSQPDSVVMRARRKPAEYETQIDKWADEKGATIGGASFVEAMSVFGEIIQAVMSTNPIPNIKEKGGDTSPLV